MMEICGAVFLSADDVEYIQSLRDGWPMHNEACRRFAGRLQRGWYWIDAWAAGSRIIVSWVPFADPDDHVSLPYRRELRRVLGGDWLGSGSKPKR
jgi:hypothetical protein